MGEKYPGVVMLPYANREGAEMSPTILNFLSKVSEIYGKPIQVQCGTNHNQFTKDGLQSDHWLGYGADIYTYFDKHGNDSPTGDNICRAAFIACNIDPAKATKLSKIGARREVFTNNRRIQIIWRTNLGGNHHNHVHIGIRAKYSYEPKEGTIREQLGY